MVCEKRPANDAAQTGLAGIHVLVVDDEQGPRELFRDVLALAGAEVTVAASARAALQLIASEVPHVLVSDVMMPGEDGYWLIKAVRELTQRSEQHGLRAVAVTGNTVTHTCDRALGAGFDAHLGKPVNVDQLQATVARLAGRG